MNSIFRPGPVFSLFAILDPAAAGQSYACGCKIAAALAGAEIYHFWAGTFFLF
ncbi:MAG: hypothetical protein AB1Z20_16470 [Desulfobacterales bacterium]|jgi:hypothetical protein